MILFIKGIIIGIGKVIPGVSGAMLAIMLGVYEKALFSINNLFKNWKKEVKFLLLLGLGIIVAIIIFSKLIMYFLNRYYFMTMMLFIGLIFGGTINFSYKIKYNMKHIIIITLVVIIILVLGIFNLDNNYILENNINDSLVFFLGGVIEMFASIIPGISGTALLMLVGIYDKVLLMYSNLFNISYVFDNIFLYLSYTLGMILSFIAFTKLIVNLFCKHKEITYVFIFGLCIASIVLLIVMTISKYNNMLELILGIFLLIVGMMISNISNKRV